MRIGLMPRRNVNQPRRAVKTAEQDLAQRLGLPPKALNTDVHDGSDGVESLFDAEALKAFESRLSAQKNQTAEIHQGVTAMQGDQDTIGLSGLSVAVENNGLASDLEQFYSSAPDPNSSFHSNSILASRVSLDARPSDSKTPPYTPSWRTLPRRNAK